MLISFGEWVDRYEGTKVSISADAKSATLPSVAQTLICGEYSRCKRGVKLTYLAVVGWDNLEVGSKSKSCGAWAVRSLCDGGESSDIEAPKCLDERVTRARMT